MNLFLKPGIVVGEGLDLQAQADIDFVLVLLLEALYGCDVVLKLVGEHAVSVNCCILIGPGCVI